MKISQKEAIELCNTVEIKLVESSYPQGLKELSPKKIKTRIKNSEDASSYWNDRYIKLSKELGDKKKSGKMVPLLPELKMESFKRKSLLFKECADRYKNALRVLEKTKLPRNTASKKRK
ncbi:MAG: hypothetical protein JJT78_00335 [Leptospira sp.]|nr:hypothetical protein [Leptospira sp.]